MTRTFRGRCRGVSNGETRKEKVESRVSRIFSVVRPFDDSWDKDDGRGHVDFTTNVFRVDCISNMFIVIGSDVRWIDHHMMLNDH